MRIRRQLAVGTRLSIIRGCKVTVFPQLVRALAPSLFQFNKELMKTSKWLAIVLIIQLYLGSVVLHAQLPSSPPPTNNLNSWSFNDTNTWTSDMGYSPISFTNLFGDLYGDGTSLMVDSTSPAWLQFSGFNSDGTTNLTVGPTGSIFFWFSPDWASATTNNNGAGPGVFGRFLEAGAYSANANYGWFSLFVDPGATNLYFCTQTNSGDGAVYTNLSVPIDWATNAWQFVALTYTPTNLTLYTNGVLATNTPGLAVYPGLDVLTSGFWIGSDSSGILQMHGWMDDLYTYSYALDSTTVNNIYQWFYGLYVIYPYNNVMSDALIQSGTSSPAYVPQFDAITGQGNLTPISTNTSSCVSSTQVWITNLTAIAAGTNTIVTFTIAGGSSGVPYDVFANSVLDFSTNTSNAWAWEGQGYQCVTYNLTVSSTTCFLILGTPQDTSGYGLTDAYEWLAARINPDGSQTDSYGVPYAWYAENRLGMQSATQDPDLDALLNYQEYLYGTDPNVNEGFSIWVSTPNGTTGIP